MNPRREILVCALVGILACQGCNDQPGAGMPRDPSRAAELAADKSQAAMPSSEIAVPESPAKPSAEQIEKWKVHEFEPLELLACYDGFDDPLVLCMALNPDRTQFVLGGTKLMLWNVKDAHPVHELLARSNTDDRGSPVRCVAMSADGKWIAAGDEKGIVRIWTLGGSEPSVIQAHDGHIGALSFSPDSQLLDTTSYSGEVILWQLPSGTKLKSL